MRITHVLILLLFFGINAYAQNDCPDAIIVCGDANYFDLEAVGEGELPEIDENNACASGENNTIWLKIQINQGGTLGFILTPEEDDMVIDFDFWLFGPIDDCEIIGTAIRCSTTNPLQAGLDYITTGMNDTETDASEGPGPDGNAFVQWITVEDNEFYYLVVDRPHGFGNFSMEWTGTATFYDVPVFLNPNNIPLDMAQCDKDGMNNESTLFDLTVYESMFIGNQNPVAITYHDDLNGAITGQDPIIVPEAYANVSNPQTIHLRMTNTVTGCYSTHSFTIEVTPPMETGLPADIILCDINENGIRNFDLSQNDTAVRGFNPASTLVTYHTSADDALTGNNAVGPLFTNTTPYNQTIWTRLEDTEGCFSYDFYTFDLIVEQLPFFNNPDNIDINLTVCDNDGVNDNATLFNLAEHSGMLTNSQDNVAITYYLTQEDAEGGTSPITIPGAYTNISDPQTIYMRIVNTVTGCLDTLPFQISIERIPTGVPNDLFLCDNNEDGFREFDLFENNDPVLGAETGTVTFYTSETDARNATNAIGSIYTNAAAYTPEIIWARLQKDFGPCVGYGVVPFNIVVIPLPEIQNPDNITFNQVKCDLDGVDDVSTAFDLTIHQLVMKGDQANVGISYHVNTADAQTGDNAITAPTAYANISNPQTIHTRLFDASTQCVQTGSFDISILPIPEIPVQPPILVCDSNNDGYARFDIRPAIQQIITDMGTVTVTIHLTPDDAFFAVNAIQDTDNYGNVNEGIQTLYIRVESALGCFDIEPVQLIASPVPVATEPSSYPLCDDGNDDTDGNATFDLNSKTNEILGSLDPALFTVIYYESLQAANNGTPPIPDPMNYTSGNRTVYARVTNNTTGCYDIVSFELIVNPLPELITNQGTYLLCDSTAPARDEQQVFDLLTILPNFIANQDGIAVSFFQDYADALANVNAIPEPSAYQNTDPGAEAIFIRFTIEDTGCFSIGFLDVVVAPLPIIVEPTAEDLTVCDTNGQGQGEFDLEALVEEMMGGAPDLEISFHETMEDARNDVNPIFNPEQYINANPFLQFVYARVEETQFGCFDAYRLILTVKPAPQAPSLDDLTYCDDTDTNGQDGSRRVDLTVQTVVIEAALGLEAPTEIEVTYYTTEAAARAGTGFIANPAQYPGTNGQVIWVRVADPVTDCYSVESFTLIFNSPLLLSPPTPLVQCNEDLPNDGMTEFDLTQKNDEVLGTEGAGQGYTVNYYDGDPRAAAPLTGVLIANPEAYTNPAPPAGNPKTLYVEVITTEGCKSYTTLTIKVLALPVPDTTPDALVLCDDNAPAGVEDFNLTLAAADISNNAANYILTYYETIEDAEAKTNAIPDPTAYSSGSTTVYVRVELDTRNPAEPLCYQIVALELILNPLPPVADLDDFTQCQQDTTQAYAFDIQGYVNDALGTTGNYDVDFFTDAALTTPAVPVTGYVVTGTDTVYVRVVNLDTGCQIVKELVLRVEQEAIAYPVTQLPAECDYEGANDGIISTWDLTLVNSEVLDTQNPNQYLVTFHTTAEDAEEGTNAIATPQAYTNETSPQTIWIRVTNSATQKPCYAVTSMVIITEALPQPVITGGTICVDIATGAVVRPLLIDSGLDNTHTFQWFHDGQLMATETGPSILATAEGDYTVIATSANGCVSDPAPVATVLKSGPAVKEGRGYYVTNYFSDNQTITVTVTGYGQYEYSLDEGPWQADPVFGNVSPGSHTVRVRDTNPGACDDLIITGAQVVDYPNFFTPNEDGFRDYWNIIGLDQEDAKIYIFDRYGKLLKQISAVGEGWDGTYNGAHMPATDYWFTVTYGEYNGSETVVKEFRAHFSLLR